jgi:ATP/maltotriose-dependent transcriptional regulator MalT
MAGRVTSATFVGRAPQLAALEAALADATSSSPSVALVAGESGLGKTRLVAELQRRARERGARVLAGDCVELGEGELPYAPLVAALRPLVRAGDPVLAALPPAARADLARLLPGLGPAEPAAPASAPASADAAQARVFEALLALLDALAADRPVLLVLEDLHWADRSTRAFLAFLTRSLCDERVLAVGTVRPDELHRRHPLRPLLAELERDPRVRRVDLEPLARDELRAALEDILGAPPEPALVERLHARSEGNPLYMEELLAAGLDGRGALPATLRDALMVRTERLSDAAQELLRVLAVARRLDHGLLAEASGLEPRALREALREAVASHLVVADPDGTHAFRHALLREVVQDDLLPGERAELHLALAGALERRAAATGDGAHLSANLAHHYTAAGDQPAALGASVRAAAAAERVHAYGEAAALLERALELWDRVPDAEARAGADRVAVLARAAEDARRHGDRARRQALLREALERVDERADPRRAAVLGRELASAEWALNRPDASLRAARHALELLPADEASPERARLLSWWAKTRMLQGRYAEAARLAVQARDAAAAAGDEAARSGALNALGFALTASGEAEEGAATLREALEVARAAGLLADMGSAYTNLADALHVAGRSREALAVAREGAEALADLPSEHRWLRLAVAELHFELGEWERTEEILPPHDRRHQGKELLNVELRRAELALGRGDHAAAARALEVAGPLAEDAGEPQFHGPVGVLLAELRRRQGDLDGARDAVEVALDRIEFCSDDALRIAQVAAAGAAVEADRAERARDLGEPDEARDALARVDGLLERVRAAAVAGRPLEAAWRASAEADAARAAGRPDPARSAAAAAAWEALERPHPAALARLREAEAHLAREDHDAAAAAAAAALAVARRLGAGWLAGEVEGLAARARLRLEAGSPRPEPPEAEPFGLTPRERQVLALVARGATNREIGTRLYMAEKTASVHVSRILAKLDVRSRTQAAAVAHRLGLE